MNAAKAMMTTDKMLTNLQDMKVREMKLRRCSGPFVGRLFIEKFRGFLAQLLQRLSLHFLFSL